MNFVPRDISEYAEKHTSPENEVLYQLNRETHLTTIMPQMIAGHLQGAFLRMMSMMVRPKNVLEIGTFTGYSAICLCAGLQDGGKVHTIDINEELVDIQQQYFEKSACQNKIQTYVGNAMEIVPTIGEQFDMVWIDADKVNYSNYYNMAFDKVRKGGYIMADNVLWSGSVVQPNTLSKGSIELDAYNKMVNNDPRVENILLPIRDGIMIAVKLVD